MAASTLKAPCRESAVDSRRMGEVALAALKACLQSLPMGALILNRDCEILYANAEVRDSLGDWHEHYGDKTARHLKVMRIPEAITDACRQIARTDDDDAEANAGPFYSSGEDTPPKVRRVRVPHLACRDISAEVVPLDLKETGSGGPRFFIRFTPRVIVREGPARPGRLSVLDELARRERDVAQLVTEGLTDEGIARRLGKSRYTVKTQLRSVYAKLQVKNRTQLALLLC